MNAELPQSSGMESFLEVPVFWILRVMVRYDENRLEEAHEGEKGIHMEGIEDKCSSLALI